MRTKWLEDVAAKAGVVLVGVESGEGAVYDTAKFDYPCGCHGTDVGLSAYDEQESAWIVAAIKKSWPDCMEGERVIPQSKGDKTLTDKPDFKVGDVVVLRSGGPAMTVSGPLTDEFDVNCVWFAEDYIEKACFHVSSLKLYDCQCAGESCL